MACENAQWAKVHWVDVSGNKGSFYTEHLPVSYELVTHPPPFTGGQQPNIQYKIQYKQAQVLTNGTVQTFGAPFETTLGSNANKAPFSNLRMYFDNVEQFGTINGYMGFAKSIAASNGQVSLTMNTINAQNVRALLLSGARGIAEIKFVPVTGSPLPNDNPPSTCDLKITDVRGLIYQKAFDNACPTVSVECSDDTCPPGTCEVDCHGHKCCYNAQGNVVKVIGG